MMTSIMEREALEASARVRDQLAHNGAVLQQLGAQLRTTPPKFVMWVGRGSSDHAGVFAKYLIEIEMGIPTFASAPSIASIYGRPLQLEGALVLVISQSGRSPDILAQARMAKESGARVVALVNDEQSPLAALADFVLPLRAGEEKAVAATKSYLATLSALLQLVAAWSGRRELAGAMDQLPQALTAAAEAPVQLRAEPLAEVKNLVVLGRGLGYAIAKEIALKLKEVCGIHAEAFSSAEFLHGPVTLVEQQLTVLDLDIDDESAAAHREQMAEIAHRGATVIRMSQVGQPHPRLAPLTLMQRFYLDVEKVALARGIDPDNPKGLKKVTQTL
ncbi:glucosamine-6-phosphate deaminase NagB-II [Ferrimonas balearica]|uniref:glucosamine-6-phosphate deaminase NagB-II n=1 Tax=Ferrimonas balearica TaxID=44012 RepID=UPI001C57DF65|nr:SIS domain-containing protein [Ferrimonas balearica]MBW3164905.1 SIS domain-containing protein [Ferrimonas balearica]MBY5980228.1 SIS domain-containing protein [Ferrimonas balearica]MBY6107011.1 SIS domain-containing protein [Ferrimonas balearica]MBY6224433.1 SIS domain-containing protein [Ferrimonas balearica]